MVSYIGQDGPHERKTRARVSIELFDTPDGLEVHVVFDPPITRKSEWTTARLVAFAALEQIRKLVPDSECGVEGLE